MDVRAVEAGAVEREDGLLVDGSGLLAGGAGGGAPVQLSPEKVLRVLGAGAKCGLLEARLSQRC